MQDDPNVVPVVRVGADSFHDWSNLYLSILKKLDRPLSDDLPKRHRTDELRYETYGALEEQKTKVLIIDDAQNIIPGASREWASRQLDHLGNLIELDIVIIMAGTYELLKVSELSGQIRYQSTGINFSRYNNEIQDLKVFRNILMELQRRVPVQTMPDFMAHFDYLYAHSIGCVGILHNWLSHALYRSLNEGETTVTLKNLRQTELDSSTCIKLLNEAKDWEEHLQRELKLEDDLLSSCFPKVLSSSIKSPKTPKKRRPGMRTPH